MTRRSQASASSIAPPMQRHGSTHTVGLGISSARFQASRIGRRNARRPDGSAASAPRSLKSIPLENIGPSPRTTTQCTTLTRAASNASRIPSTSSAFIPFRR